MGGDNAGIIQKHNPIEQPTVTNRVCEALYTIIRNFSITYIIIFYTIELLLNMQHVCSLYVELFFRHQRLRKDCFDGGCAGNPSTIWRHRIQHCRSIHHIVVILFKKPVSGVCV
jgi:hypothetical protein